MFIKKVFILQIITLVFILGFSTQGCNRNARKKQCIKIKVMTYNVHGYRLYNSKRIPAIMKILKESDADVIALQEVRSWFVSKLIKEKWVRAKYYGIFFPIRKNPFGSLYTISKHPIERIANITLPSKRNRKALITYIRIKGKLVAVANVHLESPLLDSYLRVKQLNIVFDKLKDSKNAILLGDFNFGDGEQPESSHIDNKFIDMWMSLKPGNHGYTWDMETNWIARKNAFRGERSRRLDRILIKSSTMLHKNIYVTGNNPVKYSVRKKLKVRRKYKIRRKKKVIWKYRVKWEYIVKNIKFFPSDHFAVIGIIGI